MVSSSSKNLITAFVRSRLYELFGLSFLVFFLVLSIALLTHTSTDPSWNFVVDSETQNLLGSFGAIMSDLFLQLFGSLSYVIVLFFLAAGCFLFTHPKGTKIFFRSIWFLNVKEFRR